VAVVERLGMPNTNGSQKVSPKKRKQCAHNAPFRRAATDARASYN
jgi:hypothetical protein